MRPDEYQNHLLQLIRRGDALSLSALLDDELDPDWGYETRRYRDQTLITHAVNARQIECVRLLIDAGADMEARCEYGWTPLMVAVENEFSDGVRLLAHSGADLEARDGNAGCTPL